MPATTAPARPQPLATTARRQSRPRPSASPARRLLAAAGLLTLALALPSAPAPARAEAAAVTLRPSTVVAGPALTLGDLFLNIGAKAAVRIGDAPAAGGSLVLDAARLAALARAHGLDWRPASTAERAVIERDSVAVTAADIGARVLLELTRRGLVTEALNVEPALGSRPLYRPRNAELAIDAVTTDPGGRRFSAILAIVGDGQARQTLPISGRLTRAVAVPVLRRALRPGEAIEAGDIAWSEVSDRQLPTTAVREPERLIGQAARRALAPGALVLISDLRATRLVAKGQPVTLILKAPGMQITAGGIAQDDGGEGDTIRVVNDRSRSVVKGVVSGAGTVVVVPAASPVRR